MRRKQQGQPPRNGTVVTVSHRWRRSWTRSEYCSGGSRLFYGVNWTASIERADYLRIGTLTTDVDNHNAYGGDSARTGASVWSSLSDCEP
jgi:hypothetical protein